MMAVAAPSPKNTPRKLRSAGLSLSLPKHQPGHQPAPAMMMPGDPPELGLAQTGKVMIKFD